MARRRQSTAIVRYSAPRSVSVARPIVVRVPSAPAKRPRRRSSGGGGGGTSAMSLGKVALAGAVVGLAESSGILAKLPTVPLLGRKGVLALAAWYYSKHGGGQLARDVALCAAAVSGYELGKQGSISGDD